MRDLLLQCCMDEGADIRQSALALLGDLARVSRNYLCQTKTLEPIIQAGLML